MAATPAQLQRELTATPVGSEPVRAFVQSRLALFSA
jgi:hypothetical protein